MSIFFPTNVTSLMIQRQLLTTNFKLSRSMERLSSGLRINRAADDASGLFISERMRARIGGIRAGIANAQLGISMSQTADGGATEINAVLQDMRDLAVQAGSNTLSAEQRSAIGDQLVALREEIDNIASRTSFNGNNLLTGAFSVSTASTIGPIADGGDDDTATVAIDVASAETDSTYNITVVGNDITLTNVTRGTSQTLTVADLTGDGATQVLNFDSLGVQFTLTEVQGAGGDGVTSAADLAAGLDGASIVTTGDGVATLRVGADVGDDVSLTFSTDLRSAAIGNGGTEDIGDLVVDDTAVATVGDANTLLGAIDSAISQVSAFQTRNGGSENRLTHTINNQNTTLSSLVAAESAIRDVDVAAETVRMVALGIQREAILALLSQANVMAGSVLQLLKPL